MLALSTTHHVSIAVGDMDRSIAFYRDVFGLELLHDWVSDADYLGTITGFGSVRMRLAFLRLLMARQPTPVIVTLLTRAPPRTRPPTPPHTSPPPRTPELAPRRSGR